MQRLVALALCACAALVSDTHAQGSAGLAQQHESYRRARAAQATQRGVRAISGTSASRSDSSLARERRRSLTATAGKAGRALQQASSSPPVCTWVGAKDGSCKPTDGCCRVNPAHLLQNFANSFGNKMALFPNDASVCNNILAPTKLDTVKAVSGILGGGGVTRCWIVHGLRES